MKAEQAYLLRTIDLDPESKVARRAQFCASHWVQRSPCRAPRRRLFFVPRPATLKDLRTKPVSSAASIKANSTYLLWPASCCSQGYVPMEATRMRFIKSMAIIPAAIATCGLVAGCFSYHRTVDETTTPAPVVETVPAPAPAVVEVPAPAVVTTAPVTSSSTTTTTTDSAAPGVVERQRTTTYTAPY